MGHHLARFLGDFSNFIMYYDFRIKKMLRLLMASEDGYLYVYSLDVNEGGDCALIRQFHLSSRNEEAVSNVEAVKMEQQQLEATTTNSSASPTPPDQVDSTSSSPPPPPTKLSESEFLIEVDQH